MLFATNGGLSILWYDYGNEYPLYLQTLVASAAIVYRRHSDLLGDGGRTFRLIFLKTPC
jgi:hypothetical protein